MSIIKTIATKVDSWPTWGQILFAFMLVAVVNAIVNPLPKETQEQKTAKAEKSAAYDAQKRQEDAENNAVTLAHQWLKENLNDPDSVEWKGTRVYKNLDICIEFSAKNAMGGRIKGFATVIGAELKINNLKAWNKRCGDGGSVRYY
jgi:hypothetical protein